MEQNQESGNAVLKGSSIEDFFNDTYEEEKVEEVVITPDEFFNENIIKEDGLLKDTPSEEEAPKAEVTPQANSFYTSLVKDMIEEGDWIDGDVELESGEKVLISEIKDLTPELFKEIKKAQKKIKEEDFDSKYISKEGLDETALKMLELKKAGGDLSKAIKEEVQFVNPLKGLDLDNENVQANLVFQKYAAQGIDRDIIEMKIEKLIKDSQLDLEADKIVKEVNANFNARLEKETNIAKDIKREAEESQKVFKKSISEALKGLDIKKESLVKNLIDKTAKFDENGLTETDRLYFDSKETPELHAKIAFLLSDEKAFSEFYNAKAKLESKKEATRTILQITPRSSTNKVTTEGNALEEFFKH